MSVFRIAHISDLHCGSPYFQPNLMERAVAEVNDLGAQVVVCSGDLTEFGFKHEFAEAKAYLDRLACEALLVVPGNHDSRKSPYHGQERIIRFSADTLEFEKHTGRIEDELRSGR